CSQPHLQPLVTSLFVRPDPKGHVPRVLRQRVASCSEKDRPLMTIALPQTQLQMSFAYDARRGDRFNCARKKKRLRIPIAERLQHFVPANKIEVQLRETDLVIEPQLRLQIFIRQ